MIWWVAIWSALGCIACLWGGIQAYAGRSRRWIDARGSRGVRGWAVAGIPLIGVALGLLTIIFIGYAIEHEGLMGLAVPNLLALAGLFFACGFFFCTVKAPTFLLPGWVRERLQHGDSLTTSLAPPDIQPKLEHPVNQLPQPEHSVDPSREYALRADVRAFALRAVGAAAGVVYFVVALWAEFFGADPSGSRVVVGGSLLLIVLFTVALFFCVKRLIRPPHVVLNHEGIRGPGWFLRWDEITQITPVHELEYRSLPAIHVTPPALQRVYTTSRKTDGSRFHTRTPETFIRLPELLAVSPEQRLAALRTFHQHYATSSAPKNVG